MDTRILMFVEALNEKFSTPEHIAENHRHISRVYIDKGARKFVRLYKKAWIPDSESKWSNEENAQRMAFCFVDVETMDILKPAGWKSPAKGARASIATPTAMQEAVREADPYGSWLYR